MFKRKKSLFVIVVILSEIVNVEQQYFSINEFVLIKNIEFNEVEEYERTLSFYDYHVSIRTTDIFIN